MIIAAQKLHAMATVPIASRASQRKSAKASHCVHTRRCTRRLAARVIPPGEESRAQSKRAASWSTHANALLLRWLHAMATVPSSRDACRDVRQRTKKVTSTFSDKTQNLLAFSFIIDCISFLKSISIFIF